MMRSVVLSAVSSLALVSSAFAADIYPAPVSYKEAPALLPVSTWAGFYLGVNGGYGGNSSLGFREDAFFPFTPQPPFTNPNSILFGDTTIAGGFGGGQLGYNFQMGSFVLGFEADIQGSGIKGSGARDIFNASTGTTPPGPGGLCGSGAAAGICAAKSDVNVDFFGTVRGRLGYSWDNVLLYGTGGFAYGGVKSSFTYTDDFFRFPEGGRVSNSKTATGWTAGAGIEVKLAPNWSLKGEYQFIDLGSISDGPGVVIQSNGTNPCLSSVAGVRAQCLNFRGSQDISFNTVRVGLNYYFSTPYVPLK